MTKWQMGKNKWFNVIFCNGKNAFFGGPSPQAIFAVKINNEHFYEVTESMNL